MTEKLGETYYTCDGQQMKALADAGLRWLSHHHRYVNELNVFPVPDGDTGTNMLLTMRNAFEEIKNEATTHVGRVLNMIAHGAMMGSRGNSGTILSQLWSGFARKINDLDAFDARHMIEALRTATDTAYRGVQRPVEGTILTVAREITEEAEAFLHIAQESEPASPLDKSVNLADLLAQLVKRGWEAVANTPNHLPILKKAGVVDSGGTGLVYILEGMLRYLQGEPMEITEVTEASEDTVFAGEHLAGEVTMPNDNIYDVQFVIKGEGLIADPIKRAMEQMGDSVVVVGSDSAIKVHVHVRNPGIPLEYAANVGMISDVVVENMLEQYHEYISRRQQPAEAEALSFIEVEPGNIAVIAVASGAGMAKVFQQLDVAGLVDGGQTNNPSTQDFLTLIEKVNTDKVVLLPNNKNIILAAQQAATLSKKQVVVVPTRSLPQGVAALLAYQPEGELEEVSAAMNEAKDRLITGEVTHATRSVQLDEVEVEEGQIIGLLDGQLKTSGENVPSVVQRLLEMANLSNAELVTLYYGNNVQEHEAAALIETLQENYPALQFEAVHGGQPHYHYIFSVE